MDPVGDLSLFDEPLDAFDLEGRQAAEGEAGPVDGFADGVLDRRSRGGEIDRLFNGHRDPLEMDFESARNGRLRLLVPAGEGRDEHRGSVTSDRRTVPGRPSDSRYQSAARQGEPPLDGGHLYCGTLGT
jgi:hypothetical protein